MDDELINHAKICINESFESGKKLGFESGIITAA